MTASLNISIFLFLLGYQTISCYHRGRSSAATFTRYYSSCCHGRNTAVYSLENDVQELLSQAVLFDSTCFTGFDFLKYAVSGGFAGGSRSISRILTYPFDTIKTLQQAEAAMRPQKIDYFRGIFIAVASAVPANSAFFVFYYYFSHLIECLSLYPHHNLDLLQRLFISSVATIPQNYIKVPAELIKQQAQIKPERSIFMVISDIFTGEGTEPKGNVKNFFQGGTAQLIREVPYNAFQMTFFESFKDIYTSNFSSYLDWDYRLVSTILGLFAASLAALLTQPADVIKTRLMTETFIPSPSPPSQPHQQQAFNSISNNHFLQVIARIYSVEGMAGFFAGLLPRLAIVSIGGMIYFFAAAVAEHQLP